MNYKFLNGIISIRMYENELAWSCKYVLHISEDDTN